jgi:GNAT superfamily N-acetyltransferase
MTIVIRLAETRDLPLLPAIEFSAASAFEGRDVPSDLFTMVSYADDWVPQLAAKTLWVAEIDGTVCAFLAASRHGGRLHIDEVDVRREAQGRGVGRRLMNHAIAWARRRKLGELTLTTFLDVPWNAPFYRSLGFEAWAEGEAPPELIAKVAAEKARGLKNRCAMRLVL